MGGGGGVGGAKCCEGAGRLSKRPEGESPQFVVETAASANECLRRTSLCWRGGRATQAAGESTDNMHLRSLGSTSYIFSVRSTLLPLGIEPT